MQYPLRAMIVSDAQRFAPSVDSVSKALKIAFRHPGLCAAILFRVQIFFQLGGRSRSAAVLRLLALAWFGVDFCPGATAGPGLKLLHTSGVVVGKGAVIGSTCTLLHGVTLGERYVDSRSDGRYPEIGDGVTLGAGAVVLGPVKVGDRSVVGAKSLVISDVPAGHLAAGVPARNRLLKAGS